MPLRILLADDHLIVRQGLAALLKGDRFEVVAQAADGHEAVRLAGELQPDVAVLDFSMPLLNGVDAARGILQASPKTKTILLTMHGEDQYILEALRTGIKGYLLKSQAAEDLVKAIQEVSRGSIYVTPRVSQAVVQAFRNKTDLSPEPLSPRERQVLQLVAEGKTTKEVAGILGISVKTADSHRSRIMEKLDIHETAGLVRYAVRRGLIQP